MRPPQDKITKTDQLFGLQSNIRWSPGVRKPDFLPIDKSLPQCH